MNTPADSGLAAIAVAKNLSKGINPLNTLSKRVIPVKEKGIQNRKQIGAEVSGETPSEEQ